MLLLQQDAALSGVRMILALLLVVLASSLALGICFGLMRRIQNISATNTRIKRRIHEWDDENSREYTNEGE